MESEIYSSIDRAQWRAEEYARDLMIQHLYTEHHKSVRQLTLQYKILGCIIRDILGLENE